MIESKKKTAEICYLKRAAMRKPISAAVTLADGL